MNITGRIFDINIVNEKVAQIVLRKKLGDKVVPVSITVMGYWKDKALNELKLTPKDKIKGNIYLRSRLYNGKYYTDIYFKEILVLEKAPVKMGDLFVDLNTGEVQNG
jgi:hypothetical protein